VQAFRLDSTRERCTTSAPRRGRVQLASLGAANSLFLSYSKGWPLAPPQCFRSRRCAVEWPSYADLMEHSADADPRIGSEIATYRVERLLACLGCLVEAGWVLSTSPRI
jgi:hypothetical protein